VEESGRMPCSGSITALAAETEEQYDKLLIAACLQCVRETSKCCAYRFGIFFQNGMFYVEANMRFAKLLLSNGGAVI
jgi:hypothetical protein